MLTPQLLFFARVCILASGFLTTAFGVYHLLFPRLFRWKDSLATLPEPLADSVLLNNFVLSVFIILYGLMNLVLGLFLSGKQEIIRFLLPFETALLTIRLIYGIVKPLRIKNHFVFLIFIAVLLILVTLSWVLVLFV